MAAVTMICLTLICLRMKRSDCGQNETIMVEFNDVVPGLGLNDAPMGL